MAGNSRQDRGLRAYRAKRDEQRTPEPFGPRARSGHPAGLGVFTVQLHAAKKRHYDLRLEINGALASWAVPKGPCLDPAEKRLAVHVEDHPLDYATFEGVIPADNYGAGAMIVWDTGVWVPAGDPGRGLETGKLDFELRGYKLRGRFALVRSRARKDPDSHWLLVKKDDAFADPHRRLDDDSVLSGLSVDELAQGSRRREAMRAVLEQLHVPGPAPRLDALAPMLCQVADAPFSSPDWIFELKYDGYRVLASREPGGVKLRYRSGKDATRLFPDITAALAALPYDSLVLDGEVVVFAEDGRPVFNRLQQRTQLQAANDVRFAAMDHPATLVVFDLLGLEDHDLRGLPLAERKRLLAHILPASGPLRYADHVIERGEELYAAVVERGLEGVVAKRADSPYTGQRSELWLKVRIDRVDDFAIVGYTSPQGARVGFGSLHLAVWKGGTWRYAGRVGSGFDNRELTVLGAELARMQPWVPTFEPPSSPQRQDHWVEPRLVCAVKYQDWPEGGHVRFPRFLHLRGDKTPKECLDPRAQTRLPDAGQPAAPAKAVDSAVRPEVTLRNHDKEYWPATDRHRGYKKGDLIDYYRGIAPWLLPYLRDRPLALKRFPNGIHGTSFFQKNAPEWVPDWIRTETLWSKHAQREIQYFICENVETLLYLVNLGTIALHIWSSRMETLSRPDWVILDLDPKGAPFVHVIEVARAIRRLCRGVGLPSFVKTSGQAGLHVLIPLDCSLTYEQSRTLAQLLAKVVEAELPDIATTARPLERRGGRVYIDYVQNAHGRLIAAPLSARPVPGALVSMPLRWREVKPGLDPGRFTIATAVRRMQRLGEEPLIGIFDAKVDVKAALESLGKRLHSRDS